MFIATQHFSIQNKWQSRLTNSPGRHIAFHACKKKKKKKLWFVLNVMMLVKRVQFWVKVENVQYSKTKKAQRFHQPSIFLF